MKKFVVINQKGGVGKSIFAYNGCHYFAEKGRVLFIEADEQCNSSKSLSPYKIPGDMNASVMFGDQPLQLPRLTQKIVVLPGSQDLRKVERSVDDRQLVENLKKRLAEVSGEFDFCVIDTPGANNKAANAFLMVSDYVVVPSQVDTYSLDVAGEVLKRIIGVQQTYNPTLVNLGILPSIFDATSPSMKEDLAQLLKDFHKYVLMAKISKKSAYREAATAQVPVWKLDKSAAREAGKEIRAAYDLIAAKMGV